MGVVNYLTNLIVLCLVVCMLMLVDEAGSAPPPPRKKVIIQGSVRCVYCVIEGGPGSVVKNAILPGAVVKVRCKNKKNKPWELEATTDSKGSYVMRPEKVTTWGVHMCRVYLVSSPRPDDCPAIIFQDYIGFELKAAAPASNDTASPFKLFTVEDISFYPGPYMCL